MDHHERKPAVVVRLTNQLQIKNDVFVTNSLAHEKSKKSALENLGRTG
jgi:hypothetical protein